MYVCMYTDLRICVTDVLGAAKINKHDFKKSIKLNVSGVLRNNAEFINPVEVDHSTCCQLVYGKPKITNECCKPGFIENGDNCGEFSTLCSWKITRALML